MAEEEGAELGSGSSSSQATSGRRRRAEGSAGVLVTVGFVVILSLLVTLDLLDLYPSLEDEVPFCPFLSLFSVFPPSLARPRISAHHVSVLHYVG